MGILANIIFIIAGIFMVVMPEKTWLLTWWFLDTEPSKKSLRYERVGGVIMITIGILYFFFC